MRKLNDKQKRFAREYVIDLNATRAATRAGYSEKTAKSQGQRLLTNVDVSEFIKELMEQKDDELIAKQDEVLRYLTRVMRREEKEHTVVTLMTEEHTYKPDEKGTMRKVVNKKEVPEVIGIPSKLSDSNKAAELLGKRYALFTDNQNNSGETKTVIVTGEDEMRRVLDERQDG